MAYTFQNHLVTDAQGRVQFRRFNPQGKDHYHVAFWLDAEPDELAAVAKVAYTLHPSFKRPVRESEDADRHFGVRIWTWGTFMVKATIFKTDGSELEKSFYFSFDLPDDTGNNYVDLTSADIRER